MAGEKILIVDDEAGMQRLLSRVLTREGYQATPVGSAREALELISQDSFDLMITDIQMPEMNGLELLREVKEFDPSLTILVMTAYGTVESAVEALRNGAYDYLTKPFETDEIRLAVAKALEHKRLVAENRYLHQELDEHYQFSGIVGHSPLMADVYEMAASVAVSNASVLISGESGTGKELVARSIHYNSQRRERPFVVLNCAVFSEGVLESELFGHEKGAFTGAVSQKKGRFELANQGTLFIDEVAEMTPAAQVKLLRVLQEQEFERVGGDRTIRTDVRIVAATNKDLAEQVKQGAFREDLYYRLNVVHIELPPLRDRREDIEPLATYFLEKYVKETGKKISQIAPKALASLIGYDWPGNVRELQNAIERAVVLCRSDVITPRELPRDVSGENEICLSLPQQGGNLTDILEDLERQLIIQTLRQQGASQTKAADILGIARTTLRYKMEKYGLLDKQDEQQE